MYKKIFFLDHIIQSNITGALSLNKGKLFREFIVKRKLMYIFNTNPMTFNGIVTICRCRDYH